MHRWSVALVLLATLVLLVALPAAALELQGEHRLMARYADDLEVLAAEVLVLRHGDSWVELVVTQRWSPRWPARWRQRCRCGAPGADGTTAPAYCGVRPSGGWSRG